MSHQYSQPSQSSQPIPQIGVYEKCPKHTTNDIILFCLGGNCMEPLCKECCKTHIQWHNQMGSKPELETIDMLRSNCLQDIYNHKIKFQEERAILHHFKDEGDGFIKTIHHKLDRVKASLQKMIDEYCQSLEKQIIDKIRLHKASHPGENKQLYDKLEKGIAELEFQEKQLLQPKYIRALLTVMTEEKNHDFDRMSNEIDNAVKHYLQNMFDLFVHEDHINELKTSLQHYVAIEPASLEEEIEHFASKLRQGKRVFGMDQKPNQQYSSVPPTQSNRATNSASIKPNSKYAGQSVGSTPDYQSKWDGQKSRGYQS